MAKIIFLHEGQTSTKEKERKKEARKKLAIKVFIVLYIIQTLATIYVIHKGI